MEKEFVTFMLKDPSAVLREQFKIHPPTQSEANLLIHQLERLNGSIGIAEQLSKPPADWYSSAPARWCGDLEKKKEYANRRIDDHAELQRLAQQAYAVRQARLTVSDWSNLARVNQTRRELPLCTLITGMNDALAKRVSLDLVVADLQATSDGQVLIWIVPHTTNDEQVIACYRRMYLRVNQCDAPDFHTLDECEAFMSGEGTAPDILYKVVRVRPKDMALIIPPYSYRRGFKVALYCEDVSALSNDKSASKHLRQIRQLAQSCNGLAVVCASHESHTNINAEVDVSLQLRVSDASLICTVAKFKYYGTQPVPYDVSLPTTLN